MTLAYTGASQTNNKKVLTEEQNHELSNILLKFECVY